MLPALIPLTEINAVSSIMVLPTNTSGILSSATNILIFGFVMLLPVRANFLKDFDFVAEVDSNN